jgi:hypothetical protein
MGATYPRRGTKKYHLHVTFRLPGGEREGVATVQAAGPKAAVETFIQGPWVVLGEVDRQGRRRIAPRGRGKQLTKEQVQLPPRGWSYFATQRPADYREREL